MGAGDPATKKSHSHDRGFDCIGSPEGHAQHKAGSAEDCRKPEIAGDRLLQSPPIVMARYWPEKLKAQAVAAREPEDSSHEECQEKNLAQYDAEPRPERFSRLRCGEFDEPTVQQPARHKKQGKTYKDSPRQWAAEHVGKGGRNGPGDLLIDVASDGTVDEQSLQALGVFYCRPAEKRSE